ncbi:acetyl-CoA carboxylase [Fructilactobacillus fructivorans]|uniref:Acetyl-CoA carboxylase n=2 Tax=Fructilactobacillus fructivorans TaxID=1614 RepID=A0AAE6P0G0_9LACO|nr:acetyl-CoA carboxylase [Fructilactobacillus fructivorans]KRN13629.1 hypothetical protein IV37_GL000352 [Fructilactobacillus fructivorans]QFX92719.1 acetyl-CoA carboxylase [Fructilactobacillus fructivorans]
MEAIPMNSDVTLVGNKILANIDHLFLRVPGTRYWMMIVNNVFDYEYDWFLSSKKKYQQERSQPLYVISNYDLEFLEAIVNYVGKRNLLTTYYRNFGNLVWPTAQRKIQS